MTRARRARTNSGLLADHVTTIETARDMDIIRAVLGDDKMDYFGFSYGTFLGTMYAALFPDKVDRFVLDGAVAPGLNGIESSEVQAQGIQTEIDSYIKDCVKNAFCPLGRNVEDAQATLRHLLVELDTNPLPTGDPSRPLTQALGMYGVIVTLYDPGFWPSLSQALASALAGDGSGLLSLADFYFSRGPNGYENNELQANQAINCLDEQVARRPDPDPRVNIHRGLTDPGRHDLRPRRSWLRQLAAAYRRSRRPTTRRRARRRSSSWVPRATRPHRWCGPGSSPTRSAMACC